MLILEKLLKNAPNEYIEYMKLIHELYNDNRPTGILTKEERDRRKEINRKLNSLLLIIKMIILLKVMRKDLELNN